jgi:hypothetical protein
MKRKYLVTRNYYGIGSDPANLETELQELKFQYISDHDTDLGDVVGIIETTLPEEQIEAVVKNSKIKGTVQIYRLENPISIELVGK